MKKIKKLVWRVLHRVVNWCDDETEGARGGVCKLLLKRVLHLHRNRRRIEQVLNGETLFPDLPRKSRAQRKRDLKRWLKKHGYVNEDYNECGMDVLGFDREDEYVDDHGAYIQALSRYHTYRLTGFSLVPRPINAVLSDDKYAFYTFMESICPGSTPKVVLYVQNGEVGTAPGVFEKADAAIRKLPDGKYVCKPSLGQCGRNIIVLTVQDGDYTLNDDMTKEDLLKCFRREPYIVQEFIVQHEDMKRLNPSSVNTIRITTTRFHSKAHLFTAIVRIGVTDALVDNAAAGGTCVGVDYDTGTLLKYGHYHTKPKETQHPATGIVYEGYQLPYWKESVELVTYLHRFFRGFPSMGWDVAITEHGPVVIENNYDWAFGIQQQIYGGLRQRWEDAQKLP